MASTYTTNLGIEKIGRGEQADSWDLTTNLNFDIIDQGINGVVSVTLAAAGSSGSPNTIAITDGALSDGRNKFIEFVDGGDLGATAYVQLTPNDAEKIVFVRNSLSGSRSILVFQGTYNAANDFEVPNGKDVILKFDGAGSSATVTNVFDNLFVDNFFATGDASIDGTGVAKEGLPIITETSASRTFLLTDVGSYIRTTNSSATTVTIPPNSSVAFPVGAEVVVIQAGTGQVTFVAGSGVTLNSKDSNLKLSARYSSATCKKVATDTWDVIGDLTA